jgi:hypothetical protein
VLEGRGVVGQALSDAVEREVIADNLGHACTGVDGQMVIVDPTTRSVIEAFVSLPRGLCA